MLAVENQTFDASEKFTVPEANTFGQSFRDYDTCVRLSTVENTYRLHHINQTYDFVKRTREEYAKLNKVEMTMWEALELLNTFIDDSDPDMEAPQIEHALQTAEAIRQDYPNEEWLQVTGLIHDVGKVLYHEKFGGLPQWAIVGDSFAVGCAYDEKAIVYSKYLKENPDYNNPAYNTKFGVYSEGCGLENVLVTWGHDDYMSLVLKGNKHNLPPIARFIIRYHSFYPWHQDGAYRYLMNEQDKEDLKWSEIFSKFDLYSKRNEHMDVEEVKSYYQGLVNKYFPEKLRW